MNIDQQILDIKTRIQQAHLAKARSDVGREAADKEYAESMTALRESFGVDNQADARAKLVELQNDLKAKAAEIVDILDEHKL